MKPNNLLINEQGILKIGDFGLAKFYGSPTRSHTHQVVTRLVKSVFKFGVAAISDWLAYNLLESPSAFQAPLDLRFNHPAVLDFKGIIK